MARILIETDRGAMTLSEDLRPSKLADDNYAAQLVERVGWGRRLWPGRAAVSRP